MALGIYTNNYATVAQNNLTFANNNISKSIERLSSGLRINHASDDASGLAISEKLRGQIRGLAKASMNAQDAISFLQTAEGGMEVIGDMLQRMRELAVQAGNGTYTTNDRAELQKEVTQLKEEINRISASTEYNTKKVLTGDSAGLWSTSDPDNLEAIFRGAPAEGNYRITAEAVGGKNNVYKTDIMTIGTRPDGMTVEATDGIGFDIRGAQGTLKNNVRVNIEKMGGPRNVASAMESINTYKQDNSEFSVGTMTVEAGGARVKSSYLVVEVLRDGIFTNAGDLGEFSAADFKVTQIDAITGEKTELTGPQLSLTAASRTLTISGVGTVVLGSAGTDTARKGDKALIKLQETTVVGAGDFAVSADNGPVVAFSAGQPGKVAVVELDRNGEVFIGKATLTAKDSGTVDILSNMTGTPGAKEIYAGSSIATGASLIKGTAQAAANTKVSAASTVAADALTIGMVYSANATDDAFAAGNVTFTGTGNLQGDGYYVVTLNKTASTQAQWKALTNDDWTVTFIGADGKESKVAATYTHNDVGNNGELTIDGITMEVAGTNTPTVASSGSKLLLVAQKAVTPAGTDAHITVSGGTTATNHAIYHVSSGSLANFDVAQVKLDVTNQGKVEINKINMSLVNNKAGDVNFAKAAVAMYTYDKDTTSSKIAKETTQLKDIGLFTNKDGKNILDNTQKLTIVGNDSTADIFVEGKDTVEDFRKKLNDALLKLGMGTGDPAIDSQLVNYVTEDEAQADGNYAVAGTFVFQGGIVGDNSKIDFVGDQSLINALSVSNIQKGENSQLDVTVTDAHTGKEIGKDRIADNMLRGVINGVDVKFTNPKLNAVFDDDSGVMSFASPRDPITMDLHIVDNRTEVQIGANEGQKFDMTIARMDTTSLEIDDANVLTMENSQKAITKFDQALEKVTSARATIGAQVNRLEYTMKNLSISRQNLVAAESRIRDLDVAEESSMFARNQILVNGAIAMLAQANQLPQAALQLIGR